MKSISHSAKKKKFKKDIFLSGEYVQHFTPEEKKNPFSKIYNRKKEDTINIINRSTRTLKILDIGGGMGRISLPLTKLSKNKVCLTDISLDMLRMAKINKNNRNHLKKINADAHDLPFKDKTFNVIVGLDLFCHLERPKKALNEFYRILVNDGLLILDSTNSNPLWILFYPRYLGKNPLRWIKIIKFKGVLPGWEKIVKHYKKKTFFSYLYKGGFKINQEIGYGPKICPKWHLVLLQKNQ